MGLEECVSLPAETRRPGRAVLAVLVRWEAVVNEEKHRFLETMS